MSDFYADDVDWKETAKDLAAEVERLRALHKAVSKDLVWNIGRANEANETIQRVRELGENWHSRGMHDMEFSKTVPEEVSDVLLENGASMVENARKIRVAIAGPQ